MSGVILVTLSDWLFTDENWKRLWPLAILFVAVPVVYQLKWGAQARRRLRRQQAGYCVECGLPLQGVEATRCPKCGTPISVDTLPTTEYP